MNSNVCLLTDISEKIFNISVEEHESYSLDFVSLSGSRWHYGSEDTRFVLPNIHRLHNKLCDWGDKQNCLLHYRYLNS